MYIPGPVTSAFVASTPVSDEGWSADLCCGHHGNFEESVSWFDAKYSSHAVADYFLQFARHLIYSTAMPPAQAVALQAALAVIQSDEGQQRRETLAQHVADFRHGASGLVYPLTDSRSAIQPLIVGDNQRTLQLADRLREQGCWVTAIRPPTVPVGSARLRLTLTAAHQAEDINRLLEVLHGHGE